MDAHLPPDLGAVLKVPGHRAVHTRQLPAQNQTPDAAITVEAPVLFRIWHKILAV